MTAQLRTLGDPTPRNTAPLRLITRREDLASRTRIVLDCGHADERSYVRPMALFARCAECEGERKGRLL